MCEKCVELDRNIEHYRSIASTMVVPREVAERAHPGAGSKERHSATHPARRAHSSKARKT